MKVTDNITITNEDNMELMARYPDNYFSIGITDIPYGIDVGNMSYLKENKTTVKQRNGSKLNGNNNKEVYKNYDWDKETPPQQWFNEFCRVTKNQIFFGVEYINYNNLNNGRIKWNKGFAEGMSFKPYELAYCSFIDYTKEIDYLWAGMMQGKSIKEPMIQQGNKKLNEKRNHPTQKPILLWDLIFLFCLDEKIDISRVLDTNCGLCSLALSSLKFNEVNEVVLCDLNKDYYDKAIQRIKNHTSQQKLF